jgi:hypothetical protein
MSPREIEFRTQGFRNKFGAQFVCKFGTSCIIILNVERKFWKKIMCVCVCVCVFILLSESNIKLRCFLCQFYASEVNFKVTQHKTQTCNVVTTYPDISRWMCTVLHVLIHFYIFYSQKIPNEVFSFTLNNVFVFCFFNVIWIDSRTNLTNKKLQHICICANVNLRA